VYSSARHESHMEHLIGPLTFVLVLWLGMLLLLEFGTVARTNLTLGRQFGR
jgi:hypothetical protein